MQLSNCVGRRCRLCLTVLICLLLAQPARARAEDACSQAVSAVCRCAFEEAAASLAGLEDREDARRLLAFCEERMNAEPIPEAKRLTRADRLVEAFEGGSLYYNDAGYLYVPAACDEHTRCCIYFGGGVGDECWLYMQGVYAYLRHFEPNAVFLFHFNSHVEHPASATERAMRILNQLAQEQGIVLHDILTIGSSAGSLTALRAAACIARDYIFPARAAISLDAPNEWDVAKYWLPSEEECALLADAGTQLFLFEQAGVGAEKPPIAKMLELGCAVTVVECRHDDHNTISANAYYEGVFSWGLGELEELNPEEYTLVPLSDETA